MSRRRCRDLGDGVIGCGGRPTAADDAAIDQFKRFLRGEMGAREARVFAGLSLRQAARFLGVEPERLSDIEHGRAQLDDITRARLEPFYGCKIARSAAHE